MEGSPPGSPVPGILQARTLEWVAIFFSNSWKGKGKGKSLSRVRLPATPWAAAHQAPPSMGLSRQKCWSGMPSPSPHWTLTNIKQLVEVSSPLSASESSHHLVAFIDIWCCSEDPAFLEVLTRRSYFYSTPYISQALEVQWVSCSVCCFLFSSSKSFFEISVIGLHYSLLLCCLAAQSYSALLQPHGLQPTRLLHPWDSPGKSTGVGCHFNRTTSIF